MDHLDDDNRMWSLNAKATLELEIERGYRDLKDIPIVEGFLKSDEPKIKTKEEGAAIKRLSEMYEDPAIGPDVFLKTTRFVRKCLRQYKLSKDNPTQFGKFLHCSTPAPGVILHFNSVTAKKELFVLLPSGDQPRQKPLKVQVAHIIKWHQDRMKTALRTELKEGKAKLALLNELIRSRQELNKAVSFFYAVKKDSKLKSKFWKCSEGRKNIKKLIDDFDALNPRMYREKQFIQIRIDHTKTLSKCYLVMGKQLENVSSLI